MIREIAIVAIGIIVGDIAVEGIKYMFNKYKNNFK